MADGGGGGGGAASSHRSAHLDGSLLLRMLQRPPQSQSPLPPDHHDGGNHHHRDPAVAAFGPSFPFLPHNLLPPPPPPQTQPSLPPPPVPLHSGLPSFLPPGFPPPGSFPLYRAEPQPRHAAPPPQPPSDPRRDPQLDRVFDRNARNGKNPGSWSREERNSMEARSGFKKPSAVAGDFGVAGGSATRDPNHHDARVYRSHSEKEKSAATASEQRRAEEQRMVNERGRTQGSLRKPKGSGEWVPVNMGRDSGYHNMGKVNNEKEEESLEDGHPSHDDYSYPDGSHCRSNYEFVEEVRVDRARRSVNQTTVSVFDVGREDEIEQEDGLSDRFVESLTLVEDSTSGNLVRRTKESRRKDSRFDYFRGHNVSSMRMRIRKRVMQCRYDIEILTPYFLSIYETLIPPDEEKAKQKQLLISLEEIVNREWPEAKLHIYGSCANSFGVSNSDIDICLAIDDGDMSKSDILLKLADIFQSDKLQNVQALTHARVPIVKLMDPVTGISCDICVNNLLAVVNTKLLRDYAKIDERLRQLAFIVKHWAKSRGVNETYRGTLSSYAYVLMCIHFLQLRKPPILPCLQQMEQTYAVVVDDTECAYFDQVERLRNFGARNKESVARLLWAFFHYWAYYHDYANDVISIRTGGIISKRVKDWTRRIGNDRHLICIEDPFEINHDLGRVVDRHTIRILREEFERAAEIMQYDPNPNVTLFEPYIPQSRLDPDIDE